MKFIEKSLFIAAGIVGLLTLMAFITAMVSATWTWLAGIVWPDGPAFLVAPSPGGVGLAILAAWLVLGKARRQRRSESAGDGAGTR